MSSGYLSFFHKVPELMGTRCGSPEGNRDQVLGLLEQVVAHHPADPTWYLPFIGVDPRAQGRGIGSRFLAAGLT
jgi:ribosomal protein S18 acetylase RimI-like enzyme